MDYIKNDDYLVIGIYEPNTFEEFLQLKNIQKRKIFLELDSCIYYLQEILKIEKDIYQKQIIEEQIKILQQEQNKIFKPTYSCISKTNLKIKEKSKIEDIENKCFQLTKNKILEKR